MDGRTFCEIFGEFSPGAREDMVQSMKKIGYLNNGGGDKNKCPGMKVSIRSIYA